MSESENSLSNALLSVPVPVVVTTNSSIVRVLSIFDSNPSVDGLWHHLIGVPAHCPSMDWGRNSDSTIRTHRQQVEH